MKYKSKLDHEMALFILLSVQASRPHHAKHEHLRKQYQTCRIRGISSEDPDLHPIAIYAMEQS